MGSKVPPGEWNDIFLDFVQGQRSLQEEPAVTRESWHEVEALGIGLSPFRYGLDVSYRLAPQSQFAGQTEEPGRPGRLVLIIR